MLRTYLLLKLSPNATINTSLIGSRPKDKLVETDLISVKHLINRTVCQKVIVSYRTGFSHFEQKKVNSHECISFFFSFPQFFDTVQKNKTALKNV